jgi:hypothetical protein
MSALASDPAPAFVPVQLGCCHEAERCLICPPPPEVTPELVGALVHCYREERGSERPLEVRFFGGPPPSDDLLDAIGPLPFSVRVRPDLLSRAEVDRLRQRGVCRIELDALTWQPSTLREAGRHYGPRRLHEISEGVAALGIEVGGVLAPGLPNHSHALALQDARLAAQHWTFVRLHPVLVLAEARLRDLLERHRYVPLELGEAVTVCRDMIDLLEPAGVQIVRVGVQPGPDGLGRAVAGPRHSSLRELVEARRTLERLRSACDGLPAGSQVVVRCAPADQTRTRGPYNLHLRSLRAELNLAEVHVDPDPALPRGALRIHLIEENP